MLCMILFLHFVLGNLSFPFASPLSICFCRQTKLYIAVK